MYNAVEIREIEDIIMYNTTSQSMTRLKYRDTIMASFGANLLF